MSFFRRLADDLHLQTVADAFRKSVQTAQQVAEDIPDVAANISAIVQHFPHMTPGVSYALGSAGYGPNDSITQSAATLAAQRKIDNGIGWNSIGDKVNPTHAGILNFPGIFFPEAIGSTLSKAASDIGSALDAFGNESSKITKGVIRTTSVIGQSGGQLVDAAVRNIATNSSDNSLTDELKQTTLYQALKSELSGQGDAVGSGYIPRGPAVTAATQAGLASDTLNYADNPLFRIPGSPAQPIAPHEATTGRLIAKHVFTPGSSWFNIASGAIDAAKTLVTDPLAKTLGEVGDARAEAKVFSPEDLGPSTPGSKLQTVFAPNEPFTEANMKLPAPGDVGLISDGATRPTIDKPTFSNWLTNTATGSKYTNWLADTPDAYDIYTRSGGLKGNMTPELAHTLSQATTPDDVIAALSDQLGLGLKTKPITTPLSPIGGIGDAVGIRDRLDSIRALQTLPKPASVPWDLSDPQDVAKQLILSGRNFKAPTEMIANHFNNIAAHFADPAASTTPLLTKIQDAFIDFQHHLITTDLDGVTGTENNFARLRGAWKNESDLWQQTIRDEIGMKKPITGVVLDGQETPIINPQYEQDGANQAFFPPDVRTIKRLSSTFGRLMLMSHADVPINVIDHLQDTIRGLQILKPATTVRIVAEAAAGMAARGLDSPFTHPLSFLANVMGKRFDTGIAGTAEEFAHDIVNSKSQFQEAAGNWQNAQVAAHSRVVSPGDNVFVNSLANDIAKLNNNPIAVRLAGGESVTGNAVNDARNWLISPDAAEYRRQQGIFTPDDVQPHLDNMLDRVRATSLSQDSLTSAIANGEFQPGKPISTINDQGNITFTQGFYNHLNALADKGLVPGSSIAGDIISPHEVSGLYTKITNGLFNTMLKWPLEHLVTNPAWKSLYFQSLPRVLPLMAEDAQAEAILAARNAGLSESGLKALGEIASRRAGDLNLEEGHLLAKAHATNQFRDAFYDLHDRKQFFDAARTIFPFGQSFAQEVKIMANLLKDRPIVLPRATMMVNGAIQSGFFHPDPKTGQESFTIPGSEVVAKAFTGLPFALTPSVRSVANMFSTGIIPSFGPAAQAAAGTFLADKPQFNAVHDMIVPNGDPTLSSFVPSWVTKIATGLSGGGFTSDHQGWANTLGDVMKYNLSTGKYSMDTPEHQRQLEDASMNMAKKLYVFRGLAQFALPASPTTQDVVKDINGQQMLTLAMTQKYQQLVAEDKANHTNLATSRFIDEFGTKNIFGMQSMSQATGENPVNAGAYDWMQQNSDLARKYPLVYGYFAPQDGGFSPQVYNLAFKNGTRRILSPQEAIDLANTRVATMIYYHQKDQLGPHPTALQTQWLSEVKQKLIAQFPGYDPDLVGAASRKIPGEIRQLQQAIQDPKLAGTPIVQAVDAYFRYRADAAAAVPNITGWQTANSTLATRQWLRAKAQYLISQVPAFAQVYDSLLRREMKTDPEVAQ